jgi:hypothetical protein
MSANPARDARRLLALARSSSSPEEVRTALHQALLKAREAGLDLGIVRPKKGGEDTDKPKSSKKSTVDADSLGRDIAGAVRVGRVISDLFGKGNAK